MADLPPAHLRLYKPPFYSTGVDCFGPFTVKIGRQTERRWGIVFKCMTTRCIHLDLLESLDSDTFLMGFLLFITQPEETNPSLERFVKICSIYQTGALLSDNGTNFVGGARELRETLAERQIEFHFNPPPALPTSVERGREKSGL